MAGNIVAPRKTWYGEGIKVLHLDKQAAGREKATGLGWTFETSKPTSSDTLLSIEPHLLQ